MKKYLAKILTFSLVIILLAMILEVGTLVNVNRGNAYRMTDVLLNQVIDIVHTSERNALDILDSVKDDYRVRAQSVSYILDLNPSTEFDIEELKKIAKFLSIDEIHLFDSTGRIYSGTNPEYYNLTMDEGEQISYFKPMLTDKSLTMCQDVTPNTAENKNMMYAITWDKAGKKMVQIGIEPYRLLEVMRRTQISEVMHTIPVYDGIDLFVADSNTGAILGTSRENRTINNISELNIDMEQIPVSVIKHKKITVEDDYFYSSFRKSSDYIFCVAYNVSANVKHLGFTMWIVFIYLLIAAVCVTFTIVDKVRSTEEKMVQYKVLLSMSKIYYSMHLINLKNNTVSEYSSNEKLRSVTSRYTKADEMMREIMSESVSDEFKESMLSFTDINTVAERMTGKKIITEDFIGVSKKWFRASFIMINARKSSVPESVIFTIQDIEEEKNKEAILVHKSTTDELTGCYNRRAYQDDLKELKLLSDFVFVSFDLNELKNTNDTIGHEGGDELIITAAKFMKKCFSEYGKIYRTGGDEFVAILSIFKEQFEERREEFDCMLNSWTGNLVKSISVSYGYVFSDEEPWVTVHDIEKEADKRMYKSKALYYSKSGVDRRTNQKAYFAASALYTKILKINLTSDTYKIVNMDKSEQSVEKGFKNSISQWLKEFALSGQVYEDDKENYLKNTDLNFMREYFASGKKLLSFSYRRKINADFKQVMMEIIPSDDYTEKSQTCYLYVKKIDN